MRDHFAMVDAEEVVIEKAMRKGLSRNCEDLEGKGNNAECGKCRTTGQLNLDFLISIRFCKI
ncbi:hypothetical protein A6X21_08475 [Planctopirus hydrillae]|uniref:Uncharacterized protein n=1 Tax=Planctopirus hydrillae TaxID=1841610 RepID=A0A1C3E886_9PLAN|nr:hypothetical protein A6X21_08475 [Planctopirus hydrillae]